MIIIMVVSIASMDFFRMELAEIKKLAEERRKEKMEDRMARQKVKDQIAKDREAREACSKPHVPAMAPQPTVEIKKDYTTCKLQVGESYALTIKSGCFSE